MNGQTNGNGKVKDESSTVIYNPANPYLVSPYEPLQSTQDTNTLRIVYTDVITSFTPNTEIQVGAPVTIENVTVNGSNIGSAGQISNGATSVRADLAAIRYTIAGDQQVVFTPGNAQFASALTSYNVTIGGKWNIYNTVATTQKGLAGYVPFAVNDTQYSMPIFADASFSIVPTPTSETVSGTTAINGNTDITYLAGSTNSLPIGTVAGQKKLLINLNGPSQSFSPLANNALQIATLNTIVVGSLTTVYIGGSSLTDSSNIVIPTNIVTWNPTTSTYASFGGNGLPNTQCFSIKYISPTEIYAGIEENTPGGGCIYRWNGTTWSLVGNGVNAPGNAIVYAIEYDTTSNNLYLGGTFQTVNNTVIPSVGIGLYNTSTNLWSTSLGSVNGGPATVRAILKVGTDIFVGGNFTDISGTAMNSIGRWNGTTWSALGGGLSGVGSDGCRALGTDGTYLYVGGSFTGAGGVANTANFARYNIGLNTWESITTAGQLNGQCNTIAVTPTDVYIGGQFTLVNGVTGTERIARYDLALSTWFPLVTGIGNNVCNTIAIDALSNLYAGGSFTQVSTQTINYITYYSSTNQTVISAVAGALLRNGATYTTMTFKRQYSTILLCYNGTEWVIIQTNPFVLFT